MKFSRNQITKAGKTILSAKTDAERNNALEKINVWRTNHLHPLNVMKNALLRTTEKNKIEPILVSQRLKRLTSIEYKLDLNVNMGLGGMQDIGGFRTVLKDTKDLFKLKKILDRNNFNHKIKRVVDYVENPKESGYRSIHYIYVYTSKIDKYKGLILELQIRTKLQHNWATAVETAGILTKTSLKSSQGPDEWLDFFKIVSSLFAIKEKFPVLEEHSQRTMESLMVDCYKKSKKLNVLTILKGLQVSARKIEIDKYVGEYYIINISIKEKNVRIRTFKKSEYERATKQYLELEKSINNTENAVVLVSSISIKSLKKAYPSYFLDTSEFITALEKVNENCKLMKLVK
ncbi:MAG: RelA/SpoT domain-containing protein [Pricia sp.]